MEIQYIYALPYREKFVILAISEEDYDLHGFLVSRKELTDMVACGLPLREAFGRFVARSREEYGGVVGEGDYEVAAPTYSLGVRLTLDALDVLEGFGIEENVRCLLSGGDNFTVES